MIPLISINLKVIIESRTNELTSLSIFLKSHFRDSFFMEVAKMADKTVKIRLVLKHDTEENWAKAANFIPKQGEVIIYDGAAGSPSRVKIGDGVTKVNDLPFVHKYLLDNQNTFTAIQKFSAEGIEIGSVRLSETALQELEAQAEQIPSKQDKTDNSLVTSAKTIVGAINELKGAITTGTVQNAVADEDGRNIKDTYIEEVQVASAEDVSGVLNAVFGS